MINVVFTYFLLVYWCIISNIANVPCTAVPCGVPVWTTKSGIKPSKYFQSDDTVSLCIVD